ISMPDRLLTYTLRKKGPQWDTGKVNFSNLTRTGHRLLFGCDGGITITMPCAPGIRLVTAIGHNSIKI
ncbi:hypothetical protein M8368_24700, partial [Enterobacter kobei]|nr:hypothetical protein [Enterobacter kobei]